ncbi:protein of unknown function (DUF1996) domain containing protein [Naviculisporaceae sp. PSN 640]
MLFTTTLLAALIATAEAAKDRRTFAVLRHYGKGPLTTCRADPIINPGAPSAHLHTIMGASGFGLNSTGEDLMNSRCTTAKPKADKSAYWFPTLFFKDPEDGHFEQVNFFYMNVYYFFEATDDDIKAFPVGLQMLSGNAAQRAPPSGGGRQNLDPSKGPVQPAQITCPRGNFDPPSWPENSDGTMAGMGDPNNKGSGVGFPFQDCDGYASPMRMDLHFPSCYNPAAGLTNYKNNMAFPSSAGNGKVNCPKGWIHVPHIFYEVYWDTHKLLPRYQHMLGKESPFVWANGDTTGYSIHGDFISGWDEKALQQIIDSNCDAGHAGIHSCPGLIGGVNDDSEDCTIECPIQEATSGNLAKLPGNNPLTGWKYGAGTGGGNGGNNPAPEPPVIKTPTVAPPAPAPTSTFKADPPPPPPTKPTSSQLPVGGGDGDYHETVEVPAPQPTSTKAAPPPPPPPAVETPKPEPEPIPAPVEGKKTTTVWETETVWATTTVYGKPPKPTAKPSPSQDTKAVGDFKYAGCYRDSEARVLSGEIRPNLGRISNSNCVEYCASKGFSAAGTEYGGQCYCGNALSKVEKIPESECSMTCEGAADEKCGGGWALSVFTKTGTVNAAKRSVRGHGHAHFRRSSGHGHGHHFHL